MILNADVLDGLAALPSGLAQCVVTSPPYYGLRDYGVPPTIWPDGWVGCLGLEPTPQLYLDHLVLVLAEGRRVLRDDGVLWLNIGDSYAASGRGGGGGSFQDGDVGRKVSKVNSRRAPAAGGYQQGDRLGIPERLALALQADSWVWRQTVVWAKPNPLPESVSGWSWGHHRLRVKSEVRKAARELRPVLGGVLAAIRAGHDGFACPGCPKCEANDGLVLRRGSWRPTTAHEYLYMLTKPGPYFGDGEAVREAAKYPDDNRKPFAPGSVDSRGNGHDRGGGSERTTWRVGGRNPRSVWTIPTQPFPEAHFATFPEKLVEPCILSSTPERCCSECGAAWAPVVESHRTLDGKPMDGAGSWAPENAKRDGQRRATGVGNWRWARETRTLDHRPTCTCNSAHRPAVVLDPFAGAGTVGLVAERLGRRFVGLELSTAYAAMAGRRIAAGTEQLQLGL